MRYIDTTLITNEEIVYWTRPHWIIFFPAIFACIIAILIFWHGPNLLNLLNNQQILSMPVYRFIALCVFLFALFTFIKAYITFKSSEYGITNKRVVMKVGWIQRDALEIFLDKIEAVRVDQTISGRILNYGTAIIIGTGGTKDPFFNVPDPLNFRRRIQQQIDIFEEQILKK